jgi:hypothetical protein
VLAALGVDVVGDNNLEELFKVGLAEGLIESDTADSVEGNTVGIIEMDKLIVVGISRPGVAEGVDKNNKFIVGIGEGISVGVSVCEKEGVGEGICE